MKNPVLHMLMVIVILAWYGYQNHSGPEHIIKETSVSITLCDSPWPPGHFDRIAQAQREEIARQKSLHPDNRDDLNSLGIRSDNRRIE